MARFTNRHKNHDPRWVGKKITKNLMGVYNALGTTAKEPELEQPQDDLEGLIGEQYDENGNFVEQFDAGEAQQLMQPVSSHNSQVRFPKYKQPSGWDNFVTGGQAGQRVAGMNQQSALAEAKMNQQFINSQQLVNERHRLQQALANQNFSNDKEKAVLQQKLDVLKSAGVIDMGDNAEAYNRETVVPAISASRAKFESDARRLPAEADKTEQESYEFLANSEYRRLKQEMDYQQQLAQQQYNATKQFGNVLMNPPVSANAIMINPGGPELRTTVDPRTGLMGIENTMVPPTANPIDLSGKSQDSTPKTLSAEDFHKLSDGTIIKRKKTNNSVK